MLGKTRSFRERLLKWYGIHRRALPWRVELDRKPDAYGVMVSEFMLQQTQVKMALPFFLKFTRRFPDVKSLANADEQEVLRLWQGLGYYSRARNLRRAAMEIMDRFAGSIPITVDELRTLPGIGRYTAGAIASIAHGTSAPIVDANVARVICRLDLIRDDPRARKVLDVLWTRAETLVAGKQPGDFNSAMMELGSTICTPRNPDCPRCPVRMHCEAWRAGLQREIPPVRNRQPVPLEKRVTLCIEKDGQWLIEQRPPTGRWASLWQFTTFPSPLPVNKTQVKKLGMVQHALTHRRYEFTAYRCSDAIPIPPGTNRKWVKPNELEKYPMSKPQCEIARMLKLI